MLYFVLEQITFKKEEKETSLFPMGRELINYSITDKDRSHTGNKALEKKAHNGNSDSNNSDNKR